MKQLKHLLCAPFTAQLATLLATFGYALYVHRDGLFWHLDGCMEYKEVPDLDADMQMFTEMLVRIGNLQQMQ